MAIRVCVAGATGWTGRAVADAILGSSEFQLVGAIARRQVGVDIGEALDRGRANLNIVASVEEALAVPTDVLIDYTSHDVVKDHIVTALDRGVRVVVGTSCQISLPLRPFISFTHPYIAIFARVWELAHVQF